MIKTLNLLATGIILAGACTVKAEQKPVYLDPKAPLEERVEDALKRMTTEEKIAVIHAQSKFSSPGVKRLGIPEVWTADGPHGVRPEVFWDDWNQAGWGNDSCVAFPALTALAATWDPSLALRYGRALGEEARYRNKNIILGPGINIYRTPLNGRNFEYMGEDPYLAGRLAAPYIRGVQENGVAACVKHYAFNNNELNRHTSNVHLSDRAMREIYLPAFKTAVDSGTWTIMGAYNLMNDEHLCHNDLTLNKILKDEWGFKGAVLSDWGGTHDTPQAIRNGLDMEFGSWTNGLTSGLANAYDNYYMAQPYLKLIKEGKVGTAELDDKVRRVLRTIFLTGMNPDGGYGSMLSPEHYATAREIGNDAIVLLQNKGDLLPLDPNAGKKILVVGENAIKMMTVGGGSSQLKVQHEISPLDGIRAQAGNNTVTYARGYKSEVLGDQDGLPAQKIDDPRTPQELAAEAVDMARDADIVIFVGGLNKNPGNDCEDSDRKDINLPYGQDRLIADIAKVNPNIVMVNISGNAIAMPWIDRVPAIMQAWYLGSEAGNSIADVLFGAVNPSGRLPFTFPARLADTPATQLGERAYPGIKRADENIWDIYYDEDILVGYRWYDTKKIRPLFPFGHGLSYTTFAYGPVKASAKEMAADGSITFTVPVTNTGKREGRETVQFYISDAKASVLRPVKELKGFDKVTLAPGETRDVTFTVKPDDLKFYDESSKQWVAEPGKFTFIAAPSAGAKGSTATFTLK